MVKNSIKLSVLFISIIFSQEVVTPDSLKTNQSQLIELENQIKDKDKLISALKSDIDKERSTIKDLTSKIGKVELEKTDSGAPDSNVSLQSEFPCFARWFIFLKLTTLSWSINSVSFQSFSLKLTNCSLS